MLTMGSEDETTPRPNVLHRRYQQLQKWKGSETDQASDQIKDNTKVQFPLPIQFLAACSNNDMPEIKRLLDLRIDINVANVDGLTALHQACIDNDLDLVEFLIRQNADVNVQDNEGWTPLHATASCGYMEVAKFLIENGANLAIVSYDIELASDVAQGEEMLHFLLEEMEKQSIDGHASRSHEETVMLADAKQWLETKNYNPTIDNRTRATPLHVAASKEYLDVMRVLLQIPEVEVDSVDCDGWTPLHAAAHWGKKAACRMLTEAGANMNALTFANQTLFEIADDDMGPTLRSLKEEQRLNNQRKINMPDPVITRPDSTRIRRSSITRMSVDEKQNLVAKTVEEERDRLKQLVSLKMDVEQIDDKKHELNNGTEETHSDMSKSENKTPNEVKPPESLKPPPAPKKPDLTTIEEHSSDDKNLQSTPEEKPLGEDETSTPSNQISNHIDTAPDDLSEEPIKTKSDKDSQENLSENAEDESSSSIINDSNKADSSSSRWLTRLANEENDRKRGAHYPPRNIGSGSSLSTASDEISKNSEEQKPSDTNEEPSPAQLRTRRNFRPDRTAEYLQKRVSAVMAPTKADETETQRSSKARHVRSIRRSTQGVTQEEMDEAKKLIGMTPSNSNNSTDNSTQLNDTSSMVVDGSVTPKYPVESALDARRSNRWSSRINDDSSKNQDSNVSPSSPSSTPRSSDSNVPSRSVSFQDPSGSRSTSSSYISRTRPSSQLELRTNSSGGLVSISSPISSSASIALSSSSSSRPQSVTSTASMTLLPSGVGTNSNSSALQSNQSDAQIDYRRLYEEERATRERLERRLDQQKKELAESRAEIQKIKENQHNSSGLSSLDSKRQEDKLKEYEKQIKEIERLKSENAKMKEENGSLIRVISKLSTNKKP